MFLEFQHFRFQILMCSFLLIASIELAATFIPPSYLDLLPKASRKDSNLVLFALLLTFAKVNPLPDQRQYANPVTEDRKLR